MAAPAPIAPKAIVKAIPVKAGSNLISTRLDQTVTPGAAPAGSVNVGESVQLRFNMKAGETKYIPSPGISYYIGFLGDLAGNLNNYQGLQIRAINRGQPRSDVFHVQGTGLRFGTNNFSGLEIVNLDPANPVRITVIIGGGITQNSYDEFIDKRVVLAANAINVTVTGGTVNVTTAAGVFLNVLSKNAATVSVAWKTRAPAWADSLAAGASAVVTDGYTGLARKTIIFANDDAAGLLQVLDAAGNILSVIQPSTAWTTDTGGTITLKNATAGAIACHIGEVYYS